MIGAGARHDCAIGAAETKVFDILFSCCVILKLLAYSRCSCLCKPCFSSPLLCSQPPLRTIPACPLLPLAPLAPLPSFSLPLRSGAVSLRRLFSVSLDAPKLEYKLLIGDAFYKDVANVNRERHMIAFIYCSFTRFSG